MSRVAALALSALLLAGCSAQAAPPEPTQEADPYAVAWDLCVGAHNPDGDVVVSEDDPDKQILQTPEESCTRWEATVGRDTFTEQWDEDYAFITRCVWVIQSTEPELADDAQECIDSTQ